MSSMPTADVVAWVSPNADHFGNPCSAFSVQRSAFSRLGGRMRDFRDLKVWAKAHALTLEIYRATAGFPREERYGLTSMPIT